MNQDVYLIYQVKDKKNTQDFLYEVLSREKQKGDPVNWDNYNHIYTGALGPYKTSDWDTLHGIWDKHDNDPPEDFAGRSMSVGDIIVLWEKGEASAYYAEKSAYRSVSDFLDAPYRYYSTQRPVDINTFPKTEGGPIRYVNFDKREYVENASLRTWGYLAYDTPLTPKQMDDYELRAATDNPDNIRVSAYQLEAQIQTVGKWEKAKHVPEIRRYTYWYPDFGVYVRKEQVKEDQIAQRYENAVLDKGRTAEIRQEKKLFADYGLKTSPDSPEVKKRMIEQAQLVGHWEEQTLCTDQGRFTWHSPSLHAFALREPAVSPERLERRYVRAKEELSRMTGEPAPPKRIAEQLAEATKQAAANRGAVVSAPAKNQNKSHADR